jgi:hypothetical protein
VRLVFSGLPELSLSDPVIEARCSAGGITSDGVSGSFFRI